MTACFAPMCRGSPDKARALRSDGPSADGACTLQGGGAAGPQSHSKVAAQSLALDVKGAQERLSA